MGKSDTLGFPLWAMIGIAHMGIEMIEGTISFVAVRVVAAIISLHLICTTSGSFAISRDSMHFLRSDCHNVGDLRKQAIRFPRHEFGMRIHTRILTGFINTQRVGRCSWRAVTRLLCLCERGLGRKALVSVQIYVRLEAPAQAESLFTIRKANNACLGRNVSESMSLLLKFARA